MKIALAGGSGFIGRWLILDYSNEFEFIILGKQINKSRLIINNIEIPYYFTDYSVPNLIQLLKDCDAVVNLAAIRPLPLRKYLEDFRDNYIIAANLFQACKILEINNIVNISSISVFGKKNILPFTTDEPPSPDTFYGKSKLFSENYANFYNTFFHQKIKTLRPASVFGITDKTRNVINFFISNANLNKNLVVFGDGSGKREFVYVRDVAAAIVSAINQNNLSGVFNIGYSTPTTIKELATVVNSIFDNDDKIIYKPLIKNSPNNLLMDSKESKLKLKWRPNFNLETGLNDMKEKMQFINYKLI